jgi:hypothetical protein
MIIFCESYGQIPRILKIIHDNHTKQSITLIIPGFKDLFEFFKAINDRVFQGKLEVIDFGAFPSEISKASGIKKIYIILTDIFKERRFLKNSYANYFSRTKGREVIFFSRGFSGPKIYLLTKLAKHNYLVFCGAGFGPPEMVRYTATNILDIIKVAIWKLTYGKEASIGKLPYYRGFIFTTDAFMRKHVHRVIGIDEITEMMRSFTLEPYKVFNIDKYDVIYFDDRLGEAGYISDNNKFKAELSVIFNILKKYFPEESIAYKYHPGYAGDENLITAGQKLPAYIIAELLYNDYTKMYISVLSRSIANVEKGLAVSIADLVTFKSDIAKNQMKAELIQVSKSKILFPRTIDEFERIVVELSSDKRDGLV